MHRSTISCHLPVHLSMLENTLVWTVPNYLIIKYNYIGYFVKFLSMLVVVLYFVITSVFEIIRLETKTPYGAKAPLLG